MLLYQRCYHNGRRFALFPEGDSKPSVHIDICSSEILYTGGHAVMTDYEIITVVIAIVGIAVKLLVELINAKK